MKNPNVCNKRIDYIDNLRSITILLLIPYHLAMAYNSWGEANYIFFERINPIASIVTFISPWFMPLMFLLAGVSVKKGLPPALGRGFRRRPFDRRTVRKERRPARLRKAGVERQRKGLPQDPEMPAGG